MTVRRGFLYTGVFLIAAGGVVLLAQAGAIDTEAVIRALSLWPLAVIAIGVGLILRRTRARVPGGVVAAATPGLMLGMMIVAVPDMPDFEAWSGWSGWSTPCGDATREATVTERQGTFGAAASVDVSLACGELVVTTGPGSTWQLDASNGRGDGAIVSDAADRLSIRSAGVHGSIRSLGSSSTLGSSNSLDRGDDWRLTLPTDTRLDIDTEVSAGEARLDLAGARIGSLALVLNAGKARLDAAEASLERMDVEVNAGAATVLLPAGDFDGDLAVNAGSLEVCTPAGLGLRVRGGSSLGAVTYNGLVSVGDAWESPGFSTADFHADVTVSANVGSVVINPEGGCL
jgi:hypothetical protein